MELKYLLDTNIISELSRDKPNAHVSRKIDDYADRCATASLVVHELNYGVQRLPEGKLKTNLHLFLQQLTYYQLKVFAYDDIAANHHAKERARLNRQGLTPAFVDGQIAAIAVCNNLTLVTRNTKDFAHFDRLSLENWFE
ncbi:MAG: PIN domain-containing protein [bacterium]